MTYTLPDEPQQGVRPDLAVGALWPLLTLMLVGPLAGFAWLAFNSWALGCRLAVRHTTVAVVGVATTGGLVISAGVLETALADGAWADDASLIARLLLIAVHGMALALAFWIMLEQDAAEQWRRTFGPPLANGALAFVPLVIVRFVAGPHAPAMVQQFAFWTGG